MRAECVDIVLEWDLAILLDNVLQLAEPIQPPLGPARVGILGGGATDSSCHLSPSQTLLLRMIISRVVTRMRTR